MAERYTIQTPSGEFFEKWTGRVDKTPHFTENRHSAYLFRSIRDAEETINKLMHDYGVTMKKSIGVVTT